MDAEPRDIIRVRVFDSEYLGHGEYERELREVIAVEPETPFVWQDDPHYDSGSVAFDIHPNDTPAELNIYTSESVRSPPGYDSHVERGYWDGPVERGLPFSADYDGETPFGCEVWGRIMFFVERGDG